MSADDFDIEAFTELYEKWLHIDDEDRPGSAIEGQLRQQYRQAWAVGGRHPHLDILHFIMGTRLAEGADLVWEALNNDEDELMLSAALGAALMLLRPHPELAEPPVIERLKALVESGPDRVRFLALTALDRPRLDSLDPWLRELAEHSDDDSVRHYAYRILLRSGYDPAKRAIFADIRQHPDRFAPAIDLYSYRAALNLSDAPERPSVSSARWPETAWRSATRRRRRSPSTRARPSAPANAARRSRRWRLLGRRGRASCLASWRSRSRRTWLRARVRCSGEGDAGV
jgi:hypothetical protein